MRVTVKVFEALRTFDRPATRREIERESGLNYDQVHKALRALDTAGLLRRQVDGARIRGLYQLVAGAEPPADRRGSYARQESHRRPTGRRAAYSAARAPSHDAQPGGLRLVVRGILDLKHQPKQPFSPCALAQLWPAKRR